MTHSPQRNEVEDRGADTYLSICFLYLPYCRGVGFQNGLHRRGFVVTFHTHHSGGCGYETGLRTRIERFIGFCYYRCNDFCSTDMARGGADSRVRSGVERSPAGGAGGRWRCVTRRPEATPRHMSHNGLPSHRPRQIP